jgi:dTDP-glucose 4,6-dehydratase
MTIKSGPASPNGVSNTSESLYRHIELPDHANFKFAVVKGFRGTNGFLEDYAVWNEAPVLIGTTKFEPLPDVKNIMITGGAGFMYVI